MDWLNQVPIRNSFPRQRLAVLHLKPDEICGGNAFDNNRPPHPAGLVLKSPLRKGSHIAAHPPMRLIARNKYRKALIQIMRILLATPTYSPFVSGSARLLQDIVEHLRASGHHVEVLTVNYAALGDTKEFD